MFHRFHTNIGQFLLHIPTQTASVQVRRFSAAIYQWRLSSNTRRRRFGTSIVSVIVRKEHGVWDDS